VLADCGGDAEGLLEDADGLLEDADDEEEVGEIEVVVGTLVVRGVEAIDVTAASVVTTTLTELQ
jgi:hypothetical protein